jgi:hypothetical protein
MTDDTTSTPQSAAASQPAPVAAETLKAALKAFKKRLKLTQLDQESRIGRSPMSSGQKSSIAGIVPPDQYPRAVWEELVAQGKLKHDGKGFYRLP